MSLKIGVLLPQSKEYPLMAKEFMNGLKLAMPDATFVVQGIGYADDAKKIITAIQKLAFQDDVTLLTGLVGHQDLEEVLEYVDGADLQLIYAILEATTPINLITKNCFCNSFNMYEDTYALGKYLIKRKKENIAIATSYYDAGYGFVQALEEALYEHNEAQFSEHFITPLQPRENEALLVQDFINRNQSDAVVGFYSGTYAKEFASYLQDANNPYANIFISPFTVSEAILKNNQKVFDGFHFISTWVLELNIKQNITFIQEYKERWSKNPSIFSVLGYENGLLLLNQVSENPKVKLNTPRGELFLNKDQNRTEMNTYLWKIQWENDIYFINKVETLIKNSEILYKETLNKTVSGWFNAYLCS